MFSYSSMQKADKCKGLIKLVREWPTLGPNLDINGNIWDISAFGGKQGKGWCCAVLQSNLHAYFTDTSNKVFGLVQQKWDAYEWIGVQ